MGFFSNLLQTVAPIVSSFVPGGSLITGAASALGILPPAITTQGPSTLGRPPLTSVVQQRDVRVRALAGQNDPRIIQDRIARGLGAGNGRFVTDTIVQTTDLTTGDIVRRKVFDGSPFLMNKDVRQLRKTARKLSKANAKLPRKTVRASAQKELIDAITQTALRRVLTGPGHGHIVSST